MIDEMSRLENAELDRYQALLAEERASLAAKLEEMGYGNAGDIGLEYDDNFADSSQVTAEKSETETLVSQLRSALLEVNEALVRIEQGTYGICQVCGGEISPQRLEALPTVKQCINCASLHIKKIGK